MCSHLLQPGCDAAVTSFLRDRPPLPTTTTTITTTHIYSNESSYLVHSSQIATSQFV